MKSLTFRTATVVLADAARAAPAHTARTVCAPADPAITLPLGINGAGTHAMRISDCPAGPIPCPSKKD